MIHNKLFRVVEYLSFNSFKKKNIVSLSFQLVLDSSKLQSFLCCMYYVRFLSHKLVMLSHCLSLSRKKILSMHTYMYMYMPMYMSIPFLYFLKRVYLVTFFFITFKRMRSGCTFLYIGNMHALNIYNLPVACYFMYFTYYRYLVSYVFCFTTSSLFGRLCSGVATLPTSIKRFTVLRSPHSDKKSREQFELRTHKRVFSFPDCFSLYYAYLCFMQNSIFLCTNIHTRITQLHDYI